VTCRSRLGVRRVTSRSESNATLSAVDGLVLLHAVSARYRQSGSDTVQTFGYDLARFTAERLKD